ncbi:hypothetical protein QJS10_CPB22g01306 [Acorus calamus]|uniref:Uncharacterized protein n=1 Tax=Acorus calamus TaxID=4465 RepID=A0AAV9C2Q8_ACOCL|nr:hypothetical protein QJS10_CPB22g01306 [Acorus calamus]
MFNKCAADLLCDANIDLTSAVTSFIVTSELIESKESGNSSILQINSQSSDSIAVIRALEVRALEGSWYPFCIV